jgi:hypothetical protein
MSMHTTRFLRKHLAAGAARLLLVSVATPAAAQDLRAEQAAVDAAAIEAAVEPAFECILTVHGRPRFDAFSKTWLVAYSASGPECDDAGRALREHGEPLKVVFFRRPDAAQIRAWLADVRHRVGPAFGCPIVIRGEPTFDEASGFWIVSYSASGAGCQEASEELGRLGAQMQVQFVQTRSRQDLIR